MEPRLNSRILIACMGCAAVLSACGMAPDPEREPVLVSEYQRVVNETRAAGHEPAQVGMGVNGMATRDLVIVNVSNMGTAFRGLKVTCRGDAFAKHAVLAPRKVRVESAGQEEAQFAAGADGAYVAVVPDVLCRGKIRCWIYCKDDAKSSDAQGNVDVEIAPGDGKTRGLVVSLSVVNGGSGN